MRLSKSYRGLCIADNSKSVQYEFQMNAASLLKKQHIILDQISKYNNHTTVTLNSLSVAQMVKCIESVLDSKIFINTIELQRSFLLLR